MTSKLEETLRFTNFEFYFQSLFVASFFRGNLLLAAAPCPLARPLFTTGEWETSTTRQFEDSPNIAARVRWTLLYKPAFFNLVQFRGEI